ncbi:hypothetical protein BDV96DRAFT_19591 [Lophiotrema nucula]|uniref:Uncharacterized protein n=1 Tax=Lophiotrema nucula TaxID=690887 RepID=A0A6A5ZCD6_9PLEO|nr:hypothetical protein BDV96DRAFT_19591 [Lophiotrema nucula]
MPSALHGLSILTTFYILTLIDYAAGSDTQNFTVALPAGTTNHGNPLLLCTPTQWTDYISFFLGNYVTHALTVVVLPGEEPVSYLTNALTSLLFPAFGAYRGLRAISVGYVSLRKSWKKGWSWKRLAGWLWGDGDDDESDLQKARRCGALCMIVRDKNWEPDDGDEIQECALWVKANSMPVKKKKRSKEASVSVQEVGVNDKQGLLATAEVELESMAPSIRTIDGSAPSKPSVQLSTYPAPWTYCREEGPDSIGSRAVRNCPESLAPGYTVVLLPACTPVRELPGDTTTDRIGSSYSLVKGTIALAQAVFAVKTLYEARGDQINEYGYAAFGLTVAPYALMSLVNLLGALSRPEYDAIYLVGTPGMIEERKRKGLSGGYYEGVVGEVLEADSVLQFQQHATAEGMALVSGPLKFYKKHGSVYVKRTLPTGTGEDAEEYALFKRDPNDILALEEDIPQLYLPSSSPFAYHPKAVSDITMPLPLPEINMTAECWVLPLSSKGLTSLLPRSVKYLEHSRSLSFFISLLPLIPIGVISHFRAGNSKVSQRVVTMLWLSWGALVGYLIAEIGVKDVLGERVKGKFRVKSVIGRGLWYLFIGAPAIAGYVIVGLMLKDYGSCLMLPD